MARLGRLGALAIGLVLVVSLSGCSLGGRGPSAVDRAVPGRAVVVDVIDGDTVELDFTGRRERVRLLGVDAPESVHPTVPVQCFGAEASAGLADLLPAGAEVLVERDVEARDRYDRLLLYLFVVDDPADETVFVNRWLVANGLADTSFYEPNTTRATELTRARAEARARSAGLWGSCDGPDQPIDVAGDGG